MRNPLNINLVSGSADGILNILREPQVQRSLLEDRKYPVPRDKGSSNAINWHQVSHRPTVNRNANPFASLDFAKDAAYTVA